MMLGEKQRKFTLMVADLITWAYAHGYEFTFGEAYRPDWVALEYAKRGSGIKNSFHTSKLAIDLNLFIAGAYQTKTEAYEPCGLYWQSIGGTWGGKFAKPDGNHFSLGE
jgi:hypothetical protein